MGIGPSYETRSRPRFDKIRGFFNPPILTEWLLKPSFGRLFLSWFATYFNWGVTLSYFIDPSHLLFIQSENWITLSSLSRPYISLATYVASGIPAVDGSLGFRSIDFHCIPGLILL